MFRFNLIFFFNLGTGCVKYQLLQITPTHGRTGCGAQPYCMPTPAQPCYMVWIYLYSLGCTVHIHPHSLGSTVLIHLGYTVPVPFLRLG